MEFIFNEVLPVCIWVSWTWFVYSVGHYVAKKKFQPQDEAPKVGKHKDAKELCSNCGADYSNKWHITICKRCTEKLLRSKSG